MIMVEEEPSSLLGQPLEVGGQLLGRRRPRRGRCVVRVSCGCGDRCHTPAGSRRRLVLSRSGGHKPSVGSRGCGQTVTGLAPPGGPRGESLPVCPSLQACRTLGGWPVLVPRPPSSKPAVGPSLPLRSWETRCVTRGPPVAAGHSLSPCPRLCPTCRCLCRV